MKSTDESALVTIDEAAEYLAIGRTTVYKLIQSGELVSVKIGGARRLTRASLQDLIERNTLGPGKRQ